MRPVTFWYSEQMLSHGRIYPIIVTKAPTESFEERWNAEVVHQSAICLKWCEINKIPCHPPKVSGPFDMARIEGGDPLVMEGSVQCKFIEPTEVSE